MKLRRFLVTALLATSLWPTGVAQNSDATLKETLEWLQSKVDFVTSVTQPNSFGGFREGPRQWALAYTGTCTMVWKNVGDPKSYPQISVSFSLADLNPQRVVFTDVTSDVTTGARLDLFATGGRKVFQWKITDDEPTLNRGGIFSQPGLKNKIVTTNPTTNQLQLNLHDVDMARRMLKAYQHAIALCGGKPDAREPF